MSPHSAIQLLIVDDEAPQMKALCDTLQDQGYSVTGFTSPADALAELRKRKFDLLLTDLLMPDIDGIALLRTALEIDRDLVAIMMTAHGTISTAVEAMQAGALDYILKPFKLSAILPVLSRALAVRQLRLENAELQRSLARHAAELEHANKELESFTYSVSHDLRSPLRHINGFSEMLLKRFSGQLPEEAKRLLNNVVESGRHMEQLVDDLLRLSRLGNQALNKQPVNFSALAREALKELPAEQGREIEINIRDLPGCVGDYSLLKQVFINLLSNAIKFTRKKEKAVIEVGSHRENGEHVLFIRDNGAGFDMQYAEKLFGVFQRLHPAREYEGTGVGLSIVQRVIQRHGGRVWAESEIGKGATFYFTLPADGVTARPDEGILK